MINLNDNAKKYLDKYLQQIRTYLRGCKTVDADEVERNVIEHIESEFEGATAAVSFEKLDAVLQRLGSPQQWLSEEELSWWRKMIVRLRTGPEDWRLAYISFTMLILSALFCFCNAVEISFIFLTASFILSRTTLSVVDNHNELKAQKWLIYPSLVIVYGVALFSLLFWPIPLLFELTSGYDHAKIDMFPWSAGSGTPYWTIAFIFFAGATFLWFLILGLIHKKTPRLFVAVFRPFAKTIKPNSLNWFMGIMAGLVIACLLIIVLMIKYQGWSVYFIKILG
jgi:hypothetical protein